MNPQLEDGYIKLANEIMDALIRFRIPGEQRQCLDFILRKTYGFNKLEDRISNSQFCDATGLKKGNVSRSISALVAKNIVIKSDNRYGATFRFNKKYKTWKVLSKKQPVIKKETGVIASDISELSETMDTKDNKDNKQKTVFLSDSIEYRLSLLLFKEIRKRNPSHKEPNLQTWSKIIDLMIRIDGRDPQHIANVIAWCQKDQFWQNNILSTDKLRKQFDALVLKMTGSVSGNVQVKRETEEEKWNRIEKPIYGLEWEDRGKLPALKKELLEKNRKRITN